MADPNVSFSQRFKFLLGGATQDELAECFEFTIVEDEDNKDDKNGIFDVDF